MLKRLAQLMPKIIKLLPSITFDCDFSTLDKEYQRASHGIADLHQYYDMSIKELIRGEIKDVTNGIVYRSNSILSSLELMQIAEQAKKENYLDGYVNWLTAALKKAKQENKNSEYIKNIRYSFSWVFGI